MGRTQRYKYLGDLMARIRWLSAHPEAGRRHDDVAEGYFSFPEGAHVIFYLFDDANIDIIGIPHQAMDILNYFDPDQE